MYKAHSTGHASEDAPLLSVKETGVPDFRFRLLELPVEGQLNASLHVATVQLPSIINSLELFTMKAHVAHRKDIEIIILAPLESIGDVVKKRFDELARMFEIGILGPMRDCEQAWIEKARGRCKAWANTHKSGHLGFLQKEGIRKGKGRAAPDICWNQELAEIRRHQLQKEFDEFQDKIRPLFSALFKEAMGLIEDMKAEIRSDPQFRLLALQPFLEAFPLSRKQAGSICDSASRAYKRSMGHIMEDATLSSPTGYIDKAMRPIYDRVSRIKGVRGAPARRVANFEKRVTTVNGVWVAAHDAMEAAFKEASDAQQESLTTQLHNVVKETHSKFCILCDDQEVKDEWEKEQEARSRAKLQTALEEAKGMLEGPIERAAERCKNWGKEEPSLLVKGDD